eukprot:1184087-Prorocentrum_minimum.AAC.2
MNMLYCNGRNHWGCVSLTLSRPPTPRYRGGFHQIEATPGLSITFPVRPHPGRHVSRLSAKRRGVRTVVRLAAFPRVPYLRGANLTQKGGSSYYSTSVSTC